MLGTTIGSIAKNTVNAVVNNAKRNKNSIENTDFTSPDVYKNLLSNLKIPRSNGNVGVKNPGGYTSPGNTNYKELLGGMSDYDKMYSSDLQGILKDKIGYQNAQTNEEKNYYNLSANNKRKNDDDQHHNHRSDEFRRQDIEEVRPEDIIHIHKVFLAFLGVPESLDDE